MATAPKNEVATPKNTAVGDVTAFEAFAGAGMENVTSDDVLVPRLGILQSLSPQLKKKDAAYIEGAEEGDICELGTGKIYKGTVLVLPVYYKKAWLEWAPRETGKGLVAIHDSPAILDKCLPDSKGKPHTPEGNYVAETAQWFVLVLDGKSRMRCFLPMASTQLKRSRKWMTLATGEKLARADGSEFTAPLFYRSYELSTTEDGNSQGDWMSWVINRGPALPDLDIGANWQDIMQDAVDFRASLMAGELKGDMRDVSPDENADPESM